MAPLAPPEPRSACPRMDPRRTATGPECAAGERGAETSRIHKVDSRQAFDQLDVNGDGSIDCDSIRTYLQGVLGCDIKPTTSRMLVGIFASTMDSDEINLERFIELINFVTFLRTTFDACTNKCLNLDQFRLSLAKLGFRSGKSTLYTLFNTYREADGNVVFQQWFEMAVTVQFSSILFRKYDTAGVGCINFEQFIGMLCWFT